jgi:hypothetical protein
VRRRAQQPLALVQGLANEPYFRVLEIAQTAVNEPRGSAARACAHVAAIEQQHADPGERGLARHGRAVDPRTDHDQLERRWIEHGRAAGGFAGGAERSTFGAHRCRLGAASAS